MQYSYSKYFKIIFLSITFALVGLLNLQAQSTFSGERLYKACTEYTNSLVSRDAEITISKNIEDQEFQESGVVARCTGKVETLKGNCYIGMEFILNERLLRRIEIPVRIRIYSEVPTAKHTLMRGNEIKRDDIINVKKEITNFSTEDIPKADELIGLKVKRNISEGSIILRSSIEEEAIIHRGDKVALIVESGAVKIQTLGEALQDAAPGSNIRIKREGSSSILYGRVARDGTVIISANNKE